MIERYKTIACRSLLVALVVGAVTLIPGCDERIGEGRQVYDWAAELVSPLAQQPGQQITGWDWAGDPTYGPNPEYPLKGEGTMKKPPKPGDQDEPYIAPGVTLTCWMSGWDTPQPCQVSSP